MRINLNQTSVEPSEVLRHETEVQHTLNAIVLMRFLDEYMAKKHRPSCQCRVGSSDSCPICHEDDGTQRSLWEEN